MSEKTAIFIRQLYNVIGDGKLYKVSPPMSGGPVLDDEPDAKKPPMRDYVVVSAANVLFSKPETCIFGSNEDGKIESWTELEGSCEGALDHAQALENAGYKIARKCTNAEGDPKLLPSPKEAT